MSEKRDSKNRVLRSGESQRKDGRYITMTLNYYAHATFDSARAEMERLAA